ncbi:MAG: gliding motility-associated C-terminal domain-containing protein [Bacteroidota bacterium]
MKNLTVIVIMLFFAFPSLSKCTETTTLQADFTFENACLFETVLFTDLSQGNITTWKWDFDNGIGTSEQQDPSFTFSGDGTFMVQLIVSDGITSDTMSKVITIQSALPTFRDTSVCNYEPFFFGGQTYTEFVKSPDVLIYEDTLVSTQGCDSFSVLRVEISPCGCEIDFPNAFTPDGDGVNDFFGPCVVCDQVIRDYRMVIYDRWGETVFDSFEYQASWDGTINGLPMPMDVFVYQVQYEIVNGDQQRHVQEVSDFTLIR